MVQQVSTSGVNVSWLFIDNHSELDSNYGRESKQQVRDKVAHPVNRSGG